MLSSESRSLQEDSPTQLQMTTQTILVQIISEKRNIMILLRISMLVTGILKPLQRKMYFTHLASVLASHNSKTLSMKAR
jgi:hypothetical protein